jgi:hypothetical protein
MPKALPPQPHIDWLKKTAKDELAQLRALNPAAKLHQAQLAVAKDYGFSSWRALKARVDALSLDGQIIAAAVEGRARELAALLAAHPRKLAITGGQWVRPLLHLAAEKGHLACVDVLLDRGFDVHRRDRGDNATALHWAAYGGQLAAVERLLKAGADIDGEAMSTRRASSAGRPASNTCIRRSPNFCSHAAPSLPSSPRSRSIAATWWRSSSPPIRRCCVSG